VQKNLQFLVFRSLNVTNRTSMWRHEPTSGFRSHVDPLDLQLKQSISKSISSSGSSEHAGTSTCGVVIRHGASFFEGDGPVDETVLILTMGIRLHRACHGDVQPVFNETIRQVDVAGHGLFGDVHQLFDRDQVRVVAAEVVGVPMAEDRIEIDVRRADKIRGHLAGVFERMPRDEAEVVATFTVVVHVDDHDLVHDHDNVRNVGQERGQQVERGVQRGVAGAVMVAAEQDEGRLRVLSAALR
jgi:hypothetical protein